MQSQIWDANGCIIKSISITTSTDNSDKCVCVCVCYIMVIGPMEPQLQAASSTKPGESHE